MVSDCVEVAGSWDGDVLHARASLATAADGIDTPRMYCFTRCASTFSLTRWVTVGVPSRAVLRAILLGVGAWVSTTRQDPSVYEYFIHGWGRCNAAVRGFLATAALSSYP